jgi:hypothetical protein
MAFRHRHFSLNRLIETAEFLQSKQSREAEDQVVPLTEIQWGRNGGCLLVLRRKAP